MGLIVRVDGEVCTEEEYRLSQDVALTVAGIRTKYLNGTDFKTRRYHTNDHAWNPQNEVCGVCGITKLAFHSVPQGLPCKLL